MNLSLGNCGIIFIKHKHRINQLLLTIFGLAYDEIGYYSSEHNNYKLILFDTLTFPIFTYTESNLTEYLKRSDCLEKIDYRRIKSSAPSINSIIELFYSIKHVSRRDLLLNLINNKYIAFEIINKITFKFDSSVNITSPMNYLIDSNIYGPVESIPIKDVGYSKNNDKYMNIIKSLIELINKDSELLDTLLSFITNTRRVTPVEIDELFQNYFNSSYGFYRLFLEGFKKGKIKATEMVHILKSIKNDLNNLNKSSEIAEPEIINDIIFLNDNKIKINSINNIRNILNGLNQDIKQGNVPHLRLDKLILNFNNLISQIDRGYNPIKISEEELSSYALITISDKVVNDIPMQLKSGDKILIPMNETNFSRFTMDQLDEMLSMLDIYSNGNNKFDQIRSLITKELAKKKHAV